MIKRILLLFFFFPVLISAQVTIKSVKSFAVGANIDDAVTMCATDNLLFFGSNNNNSTEGVEPWISDGTTAGTKMLKNLNESYRSSNPRWFKQALGKVIFVADVFNSSSTRTKLFITDGTEGGTIALCDLSYNYPASVSVTNSIFYGQELNGKYYFSAETDAEEAELWVTDGTPEGTKMLKDIYSASNFASFPKNFEILNNKIYFSAKTAEYGEELWVSDGTEAGTMLVKDIYPGNKGYVTGQLIAYKAKLYFAAADKDSNKGTELWVSDGTADGTVLFKDINPDSRESSPKEFYIFDDKLYFNASHYQTGNELYVTDGTAEGTAMVQDINTGTTSGSASSFVTVGNTLFFVSKDATTGNELRKLTAGSQTVELVKDIAAGTVDGVHGTFYADSRYKTLGRVGLGNQLIFTARTDYNSGYQAWITDGTFAGTQKLLFNNIPGNNIIGYTVFKNEAYFWGNYYTKYDLYKITGLVSGFNDRYVDNNNGLSVFQQNGALVVNLPVGQSEAVLRLYNANANLLVVKQLNQERNEIDIEHLKSGVYIAELTTSHAVTKSKVLLFD